MTLKSPQKHGAPTAVKSSPPRRNQESPVYQPPATPQQDPQGAQCAGAADSAVWAALGSVPAQTTQPVLTQPLAQRGGKGTS